MVQSMTPLDVEIRRLQRHLNVQVNRERAAKNKIDRFSAPGTPRRWQERAKEEYDKAVQGRKAFERRIKELMQT